MGTWLCLLSAAALAQAVDGGTVESFAAPTSGPTVKPFGSLRAQGGVDTSFDSPRGAADAEDIQDWQLRTRLGADVKLSEDLRAYVEGRFWWRGVAQRGFDRSKSTAELTLGE